MNEKERVQSLLKENGLVAKKSFGQNFLINDGIIRTMLVVSKYLVWNIGMEIYGDVLAVGLMIKAHRKSR